MGHVAQAGTWCQRREKGLNLVFTRADCLAQVERDQCRKRGWLPGIRTGFYLLGEASRGKLPKGRGAVLLRNREHTKLRPQLSQRAQHGRFCYLLAKLRRELRRRQNDFFGQQLIRGQRKGGDLYGATRNRRLLPGFVAAKRKDKAEHCGGADKVRCVRTQSAGGTQQVQRHYRTFSDQAAQQVAGGGSLFKRGLGGSGTQGRLNHGRSRRGQLLCARGVEDQTSAGDEVAESFKRKQRRCILMEVGGAGGEQLRGRRIGGVQGGAFLKRGGWLALQGLMR